MDSLTGGNDANGPGLPPVGAPPPAPPLSPYSNGSPGPLGYQSPPSRGRGKRLLVWIGVGFGIFTLATIAIGLAAGSSDDTTDASSASTIAPATDGEVFVDPGGRYSIRVSADWTLEPADGPKERWQVADSNQGQRPTLTVLSSMKPGLTAEDYLQLGDLDIGEGLERVSARMVTSASGEQLARVEFVGTPYGDEVHVVQIAEVSGGNMNVLTFIAPEERFESLRPEVEPYMLTIEPE